MFVSIGMFISISMFVLMSELGKNSEHEQHENKYMLHYDLIIGIINIINDSDDHIDHSVII